MALVGAALSGILGMGGGALLLAAMAALLPAAVVVPVHGVVQLASNSSRTIALRRDVCWKLALPYASLMAVGAWLGIRLYRGGELTWFQPAVGAFVIGSLLWDRVRPKRLMLPTWVFLPAGLGGGFLSVVLGATGPYLAAFFLRDDLDRRQIVATKAVIQTFGHFLKIPAFLSIGFDYGAHAGLLAALVLAAIVGTIAGTRVLDRLPERTFRLVFRAVLWVLGLRLLASIWW